MTTVAPPRKPEPEELETEALIEEAQRRHRQYSVAVVLVVVIVAGAVVYFVGSRGTPTTNEAVVRPPYPLTVSEKAFRGMGRLAFAFKSALYVLDGASGTLRRIAVPGGSAVKPEFSKDGKWLAFTAASSPFEYVGSGQQSPHLWIAHADGTDPHEVQGLADPLAVGWSPTTDELAVITSATDPLDPTVKFENAVRLVSPDGSSRLLYSVTSTKSAPTLLYDAVWSPNGHDVALATTDYLPNGRSVLLSINVDSGARTTWLVVRTREKFEGYNATIIDPAGWWPKWGIGFWVYQGGMTHNNDGTSLNVIASPRSAPKELGTTLSDGTTDAIATSSTGKLAIVATGFRDIALGGTKVETCSLATRSCDPVPDASTWDSRVSFTCPSGPNTSCFKPSSPGAPDSGITVDPSWSSDGTYLVYARGPAAPQSLTSTAQWLDDHELFVYDVVSKTLRKVAAVRGVSVPRFSSDGRYILCTANDSIWLLRIAGGQPVRIAGPLFTGTGSAYQGIYPNYYHQVPWSLEFTWWSPTRRVLG